jgi:hypothetical protein
MPAMTLTQRHALLDFVLGDGSYAPPSSLFFGLFTAMPNNNGTGGAEVAGNGYARVGVTNTPSSWVAESDGTKSNANAIAFPTATGSWNILRGVGIWNAASGGTLIFFAPLDTQDISPIANDTFTLPAQSCRIELD